MRSAGTRRYLAAAGVAFALLPASFLPAAQLVISEFLALNDGSYTNRAGQTSDWIEICNLTSNRISLSGWHLTDRSDDLDQWTFPATNIAPYGYLVVCASGTNVSVVRSQLHANFRLGGGGEYLALVRPDGSVEHEYAPAFPPQTADVSYGLQPQVTASVLVPETAACRYLVPASGALGTNWILAGFGDSAWSNATGAIGYEAGSSNYTDLIKAPVPATTRSVYVRYPFTLQGVRSFDDLVLNLRYDDGFVAYLNGREISRVSAPTPVAWDSMALSEVDNTYATNFVGFEVSGFAGLLHEGANLLAIQALNANNAIRNSDLLMQARLEAASYSPLPGGDLRFFQKPTPGAANTVGDADYLRDVEFSRPGGIYTNPVTVALSVNLAAYAILYTTNGAEPGLSGTVTNGLRYAAPLTFRRSTVLRARAVRSGWPSTAITTHTYIFPASVLAQPAAPGGYPASWAGTAADYQMDPDIVGSASYRGLMTNSLRSLPTLALTATVKDLFDAQSGFYANSGGTGLAWERPASIQWNDASGPHEFSVNCGVRAFGGAFRSMGLTRKKSMRLLFKSAYGPSKLEFPLFDDPAAVESFDSIVLRAGSNDGYNNWGTTYVQYIIDEFARRSRQAMGQPDPHGTFVHLYIDDLYWGLYNVVEHAGKAFAESYYGGDKDNYDVININEAVDGSRAVWDQLLNACRAGLSDNAAYQKILGNNPDRTRNPAYPVLIDVENCIDYMLCQIWIGNSDWPGNNWRVARDRSAASTGFKFLQWDCEISMLSPWSNLNTDRSNVGDGVAEPYRYLRQNAEFRLLFADHIRRHMYNNGALTTAAVLSRYTNLANRVEQAIISETARWGDQGGDPPKTLETWRTARNNMLNSFLPQRNAIVLQQFRNQSLYPSVEAPSFNRYSGVYTNGFALVMTAAAPIYYTLNGSDPRQYGTGAVVGSLYTNAIPLKGNVQARARCLSGGQWSAVEEAFFASPVLPPLRVTEVMYNPRPPAPGSPYSSEDFEFIEILNAGAQPAYLAHVLLTNGVRLTMNPVALPAGGYGLAVRNRAAFATRYSTNGLFFLGEYAGSLSDGGESVDLLASRYGPQIATFTYGDGRGWPASADGAGHSLIPMAEGGQDAALDYGGHWRASTYRDGSPGAADPAPVTDLVLNEITAHTDYSDPQHPDYDSNDWIELFNTRPEPVAFGDWYLSDSATNLYKWRIPATNTIGGRAWIVFDEVTGFHQPLTTGFGLNKLGETVYLSYLPAGGSGARVADCLSFKGQVNGESYGRYPDGFPRWCGMAPTPGAANGAPPQGVILSEVMFHPLPTPANPEDNTNDEFIEIYNPTAAPVAMWNEVGPWRLAGGIDYSFPPGTVLAPGAYLLVVPFNPTNAVRRDAFCAAYALLPGQVAMVGGYHGELSNRGERIAIEAPLAPDPPDEELGWIVIDELIYFDRAPFPAYADGTGRSIRRKSADADGNDGNSWFSDIDASPGAPPPVIAVAAPENDARLILPFRRPFTAVLNPEMVSGSVHRVEFFCGTNEIGRAPAPPYEITLDSTRVGLSTAGTYFISARIVDDAGTHASPASRLVALTLDNGAGATELTDYTAVLNGNLRGDGQAAVTVYWGPSDGGTQKTAWAHAVYLGELGEGPFQLQLDTLTVGQTYYYRCYANNGFSENWAPSTAPPVMLTFDEWAHRMRITMPGYGGASALTNFPALIVLGPHIPGFAYSQFSHPAGRDLRFGLSPTGPALDHEIEQWNPLGASYVWVRVPLLQGRATSFYAFWHNPATQPAPRPGSARAVWTNGFRTVWHLNLTATNSALGGEIGADHGSTDAAGVTARGRAFNGADAWMDPGLPLDWYGAESQHLTVTLWVSPQAGDNRTPFGSFAGARSKPLAITQAAGKWKFMAEKSTIMNAEHAARTNQWQMLALVLDNGKAYCYCNGQPPGAALTYAAFTPTDLPRVGFMGGQTAGEYYYKGALDEVRIAGAARSLDWIRAEFLTSASNAAFTSYAVITNRYDEDGDGMLDAWERRLFGGIAVLNAGPEQDWDNDRVSNLAEFIAGTDPLAATDVFAVAVALSSGTARVFFPARLAAGAEYEGLQRWYALEQRTNLLAPGWLPVHQHTRIPGAGQIVVYTNSVPQPAYRGKVWLESR